MEIFNYKFINENGSSECYSGKNLQEAASKMYCDFTIKNFSTSSVMNLLDDYHISIVDFPYGNYIWQDDVKVTGRERQDVIIYENDSFYNYMLIDSNLHFLTMNDVIDYLESN